MAVKPPVTTPIWAPNAVYDAGPAVVIGKATKVAPFGDWQDNGHIPGVPFATPGSVQNYSQNAVTRWVAEWVEQGQAGPAADTHIVETDSDGRTGLIGLDLSDSVSRTIANWSANNGAGIFAFTMVVGSGGGISCFGQGLGPSYRSSKLAGSSGAGFAAVDSTTSSGHGISLNLQGSGRAVNIVSTGLNTGGVRAETINQPALIADVVGNAASIRMVPKAPPVPSVAGDTFISAIDNTLNYYDATNTERKVWATQSGLVRQVFTSVPVFGFVPPLNVINQPFPFVGGKRYTVTAVMQIGRQGGSTRVPELAFSIGPNGAPDEGQYVRLFQDGFNFIERSAVFTWDFLCPLSGVYNVRLGLFAGIGAGSVNLGRCTVSILGAFD
jgi:hypothetical protein